MSRSSDSASEASGPQVGASQVTEPLLYEVAANLHRVMHLSRGEQLAVWKRVLDLYVQEGKRLPDLVRHLCDEPFVDHLMHNEVFWGLMGTHVTREYYGRADTYLTAVYAAAALLAAQRDQLPLPPADQSMLAHP